VSEDGAIVLWADDFARLRLPNDPQTRFLRKEINKAKALKGRVAGPLKRGLIKIHFIVTRSTGEMKIEDTWEHHLPLAEVQVSPESVLRQATRPTPRQTLPEDDYDSADPLETKRRIRRSLDEAKDKQAGEARKLTEVKSPPIRHAQEVTVKSLIGDQGATLKTRYDPPRMTDDGKGICGNPIDGTAYYLLVSKRTRPVSRTVTASAYERWKKEETANASRSPADPWAVGWIFDAQRSSLNDRIIDYLADKWQVGDVELVGNYFKSKAKSEKAPANKTRTDFLNHLLTPLNYVLSLSKDKRYNLQQHTAPEKQQKGGISTAEKRSAMTDWGKKQGDPKRKRYDPKGWDMAEHSTKMPSHMRGRVGAPDTSRMGKRKARGRQPGRVDLVIQPKSKEKQAPNGALIIDNAWYILWAKHSTEKAKVESLNPYAERRFNSSGGLLIDEVSRFLATDRFFATEIISSGGVRVIWAGKGRGRAEFQDAEVPEGVTIIISFPDKAKSPFFSFVAQHTAVPKPSVLSHCAGQSFDVDRPKDRKFTIQQEIRRALGKVQAGLNGMKNRLSAVADFGVDWVTDWERNHATLRPRWTIEGKEKTVKAFSRLRNTWHGLLTSGTDLGSLRADLGSALPFVDSITETAMEFPEGDDLDGDSLQAVINKSLHRKGKGGRGALSFLILSKSLIETNEVDERLKHFDNRSTSAEGLDQKWLLKTLIILFERLAELEPEKLDDHVVLFSHLAESAAFYYWANGVHLTGTVNPVKRTWADVKTGQLNKQVSRLGDLSVRGSKTFTSTGMSLLSEMQSGARDAVNSVRMAKSPATSLIEGGWVSVNGVVVTDPDSETADGDEIQWSRKEQAMQIDANEYTIYKTFNPLLFKLAQHNWTEVNLADQRETWMAVDRIGVYGAALRMVQWATMQEEKGVDPTVTSALADQLAPAVVTVFAGTSGQITQNRKGRFVSAALSWPLGFSPEEAANIWDELTESPQQTMRALMAETSVGIGLFNEAGRLPSIKRRPASAKKGGQGAGIIRSIRRGKGKPPKTILLSSPKRTQAEKAALKRLEVDLTNARDAMGLPATRNTREALSGFQKARGIRPTAMFDSATVIQMEAVLMTASVKPEDKIAALGFAAAETEYPESALQGKWSNDQAKLRRLKKAIKDTIETLDSHMRIK
jgi:hypothetical protein